MKQEMQGQMAFQNKMRALKQIELSKYGGKEEYAIPQSSSNEIAGQCHDDNMQVEHHAASAAGGADSNGATHTSLQEQSDHIDLSLLHAHLSEEPDQDLIWNPEDDDQIFDFLMEH